MINFEAGTSLNTTFESVLTGGIMSEEAKNKREKRVFLDDNRNLVIGDGAAKEARWLVITEYDEKGKFKKETWVDLHKKPKQA